MRNRATLALIALSISTFSYVTTELMPVGVLTLIAGDLHRTETDIGLIVTAYALVVLVGSLPLTKATSRVPRRVLLGATLALFAGTNLVAAFAPTYGVLMGARLATGLTQALFWSIVAPTAAALFPPEVRGRAVVRLGIGTSLASVLGVPLGTLLGQAAGWRAPFFALTILNVLTCVAVIFLLPSAPRETGDAARGVAPDRRRFVLVLLGVVLGVTGFSMAWTYITPYLLDITGFAAGTLAPLLLVGGACGVIGATVASRFVDARPWAAMTVPMGLVALSLVALFALGEVEAAVVGASALNGFGFSAYASTVQSTTMRVAPGTTDMASASVSSAFNMGIAGGAFLGGVLYDGWGLRAVPLAGAILAGLATAVLAFGGRGIRPAPVAPEPVEAVAV